MKLLFASSEMTPFVKTGGLGDVAGALPATLSEMGLDVLSVIPFYGVINKKKFRIKKTNLKINVNIAGKEETGEIFECRYSEHLTTLFIKHDKFFNREYLYGTEKEGYPDNAERFSFFCQAVLEASKAYNFKPELIHLNDWQTALIAPYLKTNMDPFFKYTATIFTIHNMGYQGEFPVHDYKYTNLGDNLLHQDGLEFYGKINFMKAGLNFSDCITTVSPTYSQEICTSKNGFGLEGLLVKRKNDLFGILNGADYNEWSPDNDKLISKRYSVNNLSGKKHCKSDLIKIFGLNGSEESPIIAVVSRLSDQKGFDIIIKSIHTILNQDVRFILLGEGKKEYENFFTDLAKNNPQKVGVKIGFDNTLAHKIEAGSDIFLMPSRYEPCGLSQIYSLKYGTVPIVRNTGGLNDTVEQVNEDIDTGTGFKFSDYSPEALLENVNRSINFYRKKEPWEKLMIRGMMQNFSWHHSSKEYINIYQKAISRMFR